MPEKIIKIGLCNGRHEIPDVHNNYIFEPFEITKIDQAFISKLEKKAIDVLTKQIGIERTNTYMDGVMKNHVVDGPTRLELYTTGLSVALVSVLKFTQSVYGLEVIVYHYDVTSDTYVPQQVQSGYGD